MLFPASLMIALDFEALNVPPSLCSQRVLTFQIPRRNASDVGLELSWKIKYNVKVRLEIEVRIVSTDWLKQWTQDNRTVIYWCIHTLLATLLFQPSLKHSTEGDYSEISIQYPVHTILIWPLLLFHSTLQAVSTDTLITNNVCKQSQ